MRQKDDQRKGKKTKGLGEFCEIAGKREKETKRGEDESGKRKKRRIRRRRRKMKEFQRIRGHTVFVRSNSRGRFCKRGKKKRKKRGEEEKNEVRARRKKNMTRKGKKRERKR